MTNRACIRRLEAEQRAIKATARMLIRDDAEVSIDGDGEYQFYVGRDPPL